MSEVPIRPWIAAMAGVLAVVPRTCACPPGRSEPIGRAPRSSAER